MQYAYDVINKRVTSSLGCGSTAPYELWYGQKPSFIRILPFGTVGYIRRHNPPQKLAPPGNKCTLVGTVMDPPSLTNQVRDLTTDRWLCTNPLSGTRQSHRLTRGRPPRSRARRAPGQARPSRQSLTPTTLGTIAKHPSGEETKLEP